MLRKFKQLRKDEVKLVTNFLPTPVSLMNLPLILPYTYLQTLLDYFLLSLQDCVKVVMTIFLHPLIL